jgi:hypothetical protein
MSNTTSANSGAETACPHGTHKFTLVCNEIGVTQSSVVCVVFCNEIGVTQSSVQTEHTKYLYIHVSRICCNDS